MRILGISAYYHDSAAALVVDGAVVAAAQEERFSRRKFDAGFPHRAVHYCLDASGCKLNDVDFVVFYDKPLLKFERLLETYLAFAPRGFTSFARSMPVWLKEKLFLRSLLGRELRSICPGFDARRRLLFSEHHLSHAASAYFPSPFDEAAVLTMDGVGEWATTSVGVGRGSGLTVLREIHFPHSLGLLYSAFTAYCGFKVNSGEYKLMGLAPYGEPRHVRTILDRLIDLKQDGSFRLNLEFFEYCTGMTMTGRRFDQLFGGPPRRPEAPIESRHLDIAASIQQVIEEAVLRLTRSIRTETGCRNLCLAGGVALNCVANGRVLRDGRFDRLWIQPAAGDAGAALGSALAGYFLYAGMNRSSAGGRDAMRGSLLGPEFGPGAIEIALRDLGAVFEVLPGDDLLEVCAEELAAGRAVGWFQGRMEFGPRALGARSILADPRSRSMQSVLNLKVKFRESFRPFAPAVLAEDAAAWFDLDAPSPYMLLVANVTASHLSEPTSEERQLRGLDRRMVARSDIPAVTHVDGSARVQTVDAENHPRFHALLTRFKEKTGCPVLVNTSFNIRGEPVVCTPEDAYRCFMGTDLDLLVIGDCVLRKNCQPPPLVERFRTYRDGVAPD